VLKLRSKTFFAVLASHKEARDRKGWLRPDKEGVGFLSMLAYLDKQA
jgi:hypothetical protein